MVSRCIVWCSCANQCFGVLLSSFVVVSKNLSCWQSGYVSNCSVSSYGVISDVHEHVRVFGVCVCVCVCVC